MQNASPRLPVFAAALGMLSAMPATAQQRIVPPDRDRILAGAPTPVFAVGKEEGESWEMLANVTAVAFDRQNNLYVLDAGNYRVLVFDARGRFLRQIGKQGDGPGELSFALGLAIAPDGDVVIADMGRAGFAIFKPDGTYVKNIAAPEGTRPGGAQTGGIYVDGNGSVIFRSGFTLLGGGLRGGQAGARGGANLSSQRIAQEFAKSPIVRVPLGENAKATTLYELPMPQPKVQAAGSGGRQQVRVSLAPPTFSPPSAFAALPNGSVAVAHDAEYAVKLVDANGNVQRVVARKEKPRKVTRRDQDRAREQLRERLSNPSGQGGMQVMNVNGRMSFSFGGGRALPKDQIEQSVREMTFAEVMPLIQSLRADPLGRIWVQRTGDQVGEDGPVDLLASDGRYLGSLVRQKVPDAVSATGLAAYIERDELDVQRIVVRRLPAAWSQGLAAAGPRR